MYQNQMQQPLLPFAIDKLQWPTGNYNAVPALGLPAHLQNFQTIIPPLSQALISEIQNNSQTSPLYTFLFNQMAANGFQNNDFTGLVKSAIEYFAFLVRSGNDARMLFPQVATEMVQFWAANNTKVYPTLLQYTNQNNVFAVLSNFERIANAISQSYNQNQNMVYPGVQQQFGSGMQPLGMGGNVNYVPNQGFGGGVNYQQASGPMERSYGGKTSGLFTGGSPNPNEIGQRTEMDRTYGVSNNSINMVDTSVQDSIVNTLEGSDNLVDIEEANRRWKPSLISQYRPVFEPSHQKLIARKRNDQYYYEVKELGDNEMDPAKHQLTKLFTSNSVVAQKLDPVGASQKLAEAVSDAKTALSGKDLTIDTYSRIVLDQMPIELGYDSVWVSGIVERMKRSQSRIDKMPINIIQWQSNIVSPVVIDSQDHIDFVRRLSEMDSEQLISAILQHKDRLSPALISVIDERLTNATNDAVKTNMSISGLNIDSFIDDWKDLINIVSNKYGDIIAAKLMANDEVIIRTALNLLNDDCSISVTQNVYDTGEEVYPISYFTESVSFTMLEFFSNELDIDFIKNTSGLLSKINTRTWYNLAEQIFKEYGEVATRHLIRTVDGKVLEVKKGWLADNAYIINLAS